MSSDVVEIKFRKILLDIIVFNLVGWPNVILGKWGKPFQRGIFCDDDSIRYPVRDGTVTFYWLVIVGFGLNALGMLLTEYLRRSENPQQVIFLGKKIPIWMYNLYRHYGMFCFGDLILWGLTDSIKYLIGRLRPHYYVACLPLVCFTRFTPNEYYENFTCKNTEAKELRLSFPSGHTSFFVYTMTYFAIYLQARMSWKGSKLLKHSLQYLAIISAVMVGMTRVSDYKHHWSDVLAGLFLGSSLALVVTTCFSNIFDKVKPVKESKEEIQICRDENDCNNLKDNR